MPPKIVVYRMTYPERPTYCVPIKLHERPYVPKRFESKEDLFRLIADQLGFDGSNGEYTREVISVQGVRLDMSRLIVTLGNGEYVKVAHYS